MGTTHPRAPSAVSRRKMAWLPFWRMKTKQSRCRALTASFPDTNGGLGMGRDFKGCQDGGFRFGQRKFFKIKLRGFPKVGQGFVKSLALRRRTGLRVCGDEPAFFLMHDC